MHELKSGDIVQLNSGGPAMTVIGLRDMSDLNTGTVEAKCGWYDKDNFYQTAFFDICTIKKYEAK